MFMVLPRTWTECIETQMSVQVKLQLVLLALFNIIEMMFELEIKELQNTNFFLLVECISGESEAMVLCSTPSRIFPVETQNVLECSSIFPTQFWAAV